MPRNWHKHCAYCSAQRHSTIAKSHTWVLNESTFIHRRPPTKTLSSIPWPVFYFLFCAHCSPVYKSPYSPLCSFGGTQGWTGQNHLSGFHPCLERSGRLLVINVAYCSRNVTLNQDRDNAKLKRLSYQRTEIVCCPWHPPGGRMRKGDATFYCRPPTVWGGCSLMSEDNDRRNRLPNRSPRTSF